MRLVIGKKPPSQVRDNNGRIIRGTMEFSGLFPEWLNPNPYKLKFEMNKVKLQVILYHELKKKIIWEKKNEQTCSMD